MCTAYRKHASSRTPDASRQTFPDWQQSPISSSSSPLAPRPGPQTGFSPSLKSHPEIGMPVSHLRSLPPPSSLLRTQDHHWVREDEAAVLYKATSFLRGPGTPLGEAPQIDPVQPKPGPGATPQWTLVLSHETRGPRYANDAQVLQKHSSSHCG